MLGAPIGRFHQVLQVVSGGCGGSLASTVCRQGCLGDIPVGIDGASGLAEALETESDLINGGQFPGRVIVEVGQGLIHVKGSEELPVRVEDVGQIVAGFHFPVCGKSRIGAGVILG